MIQTEQTRFDELLTLARNYADVLTMEVRDVRRAFSDPTDQLLMQAVERIEKVLPQFQLAVELIAARQATVSAVEVLEQNVVEVVKTYTFLGKLIEQETVDLRAALKPDVDPAVMDALRHIATLLEQIKLAGAIEVPR